MREPKTKKAVKKPAKKKGQTVNRSLRTGRKIGKPAYHPSEEHFETAYIGAKKGLSNAEIAKAIGISLTTFKRRMGLFEPHMKKGRDESDDKNCEKVENSMLKRCLGYEIEEVTIEGVQDGAEIKGKKIKKVKKYIQPSDTLIMFFLVNRGKGRWVSINKMIIDSNTDQNAGNQTIQWGDETIEF